MQRLLAVVLLIASIAVAAGALVDGPSQIHRKGRDPIVLSLQGVPSNSISQRHDGIRKREVGITQVVLSNLDQSYYTLISVGNITFRAALDTASSDLWIISNKCSSPSCKSIPSYPLSFQSPSFVPVNNNQTNFTLSFADGTLASGFVARESVQLGNFTTPNQIFGLVNNTNVTLKDSISGVLGLGFPRLSAFSALAPNATPLVNSFAQNGSLDYPMFGLSLTRNMTGSLALGAVDASVVKNVSDLEWHKVMPFPPFPGQNETAGYFQWAIRLSEIGVNGTNFKPTPTYPNITTQSLALLDVGTNGLFGPYQDVTQLFASMNESRLVDPNGIWALPCDTDETMSFSFGNRNFTLQPTDYLIGATSGEPDLCLSWPQATPPSSDGIDWQLGTPFLRTVYSVYSFGIDGVEPPMVGFYALSNNTSINETADNVTSFLASASLTIGTTLPNFLLATQTPTTPPYTFNASITATAGQIVSTDLGVSTYSPLLLDLQNINTSAIPTISPSPTVLTLLVTDASGVVHTSTSFIPTPSIALGEPPGFTSGSPRQSTLPPVLPLLFAAASFAAFSLV